jgi:uncharacterized protein YlzI (FlbEa/FlbD family)
MRLVELTKNVNCGNAQVWINPDYIVKVEHLGATGMTQILLVDGENVAVREAPTQVISKLK